MADYLKTRITDHKKTRAPRWGWTVDGYTQRNGAPTCHMVKLDGESRWRRLMVWCFSNVGTLFIRVNGQCIIVNELDIPGLDLCRDTWNPANVTT